MRVHAGVMSCIPGIDMSLRRIVRSLSAREKVVGVETGGLG